MKKLIVIPSDPIAAYEKAGYDWLERYYNPNKYFDKVYAISPLEKGQQKKFGMTIIGANARKYKRLVKAIKPDVIRAYGSYWGSDFAIKNRINGIPIIVSAHDTNRRLIFPTIREANGVIAMSNAVKIELLKIGVPEKKIHILPNRVDLSIFRNKKNHDHTKRIQNEYLDKKIILHIGRKSEQKNLDTLIKSLAHLSEEFIAVFIGVGNEGPYKELAEKHHVENRCFWIESIKNSELPYWLSAASCMCTPSRWEGFGIVFIESAACGTPIVTSNIAPMNEYLQDGKSAVLVNEYTDPQHIAQGILEAVSKSDQYLTEGPKVASKFDQIKIDNEEIRVYNQIINEFKDSHKIRSINPLFSRKVNYHNAFEKALNWVFNNLLEDGGVKIHAASTDAYPEVSGYLIPTLLKFGFYERATCLADWLTGIQNENGSWNDPSGKLPYIFDTGQVLKGLLPLLDNKGKYNKSFENGCRWIISQQQTEGRIVTPDHRQWELPNNSFVPEAIHLYVLDPIKTYGNFKGIENYTQFVKKAIEYYTSTTINLSFNTLAHFHAYIIEALIDLNEGEHIHEVIKSLSKLIDKNGYIPAYKNVKWVCTPALFQYAVCFYKLGDRKYADKLFEFGCKLQNKSGGFYGSYGKGANYFEENEISWINKFFLDAYWYKYNS
jgi:glycosyltransferase involved in cell wall biosynthesis